MRYVRYRVEGRVAHGVLEADGGLREFDGDPFSDPAPTGARHRPGDVTLLAPCVPSKVIAVGLNYRSHLGDRAAPDVPGLFAKLPTSIIASGEPIVLPADSIDVHYEGEMVLVIGKETRDVSPAGALDCLLGVTAGNDVSERTWQQGDLQWLRAKACDTFGPIGPAIATDLDFGDLLLQTRVNGETRQSQRTSDLIFDAPTLISHVSRYITLLPGDLIFTGTPGNTRGLAPGDVVEVELEGVGVLSNSVAAARSMG